MPLYEYKCQSCGAVFEVRQKFSDEPVAVHKECGGAVERLISTSALRFKGSGFYVNDYARKGTSSPPSGKDASSKPASTETSKPASGTPAKSEAKPASKP
jgi:putative FmdB family regulatory protein